MEQTKKKFAVGWIRVVVLLTMLRIQGACICIHLILPGILSCLGWHPVSTILQCFFTGVKGFQYKQRTRYELRVYVDDGSLISEILIDHNVSDW